MITLISYKDRVRINFKSKKMNITLKDKDVKIKKERQCFSCYRKFPTGTIMHYWVGIYEGDFNSVYSCITCQKIMDVDSENEFTEGFVYDYLGKGETPEQYLEKIK